MENKFENDKLYQIFQFQESVNKDLINCDESQKREKTKEFVLAMHSKLSELLEEIDWRYWREKRDVVVESNINEKIADLVKFTTNLSIIWGLNSDSLFSEVEKKTHVFEQRMKQLKMLESITSQKICGVDIDGVIVDYPNCLIEYINSLTNSKFQTWFDLKYAFSQKELEYFKHKYRISGNKRSQPLMSYAKEFIDYLKSDGFSVILLSKRPFQKYTRIFSDTQHNLETHQIKFDALFFSSQKHKDIIFKFPNLQFMIEDDRIIANEIGDYGYRCFLINNLYNQGSLSPKVIRVENLKHVIEILEKEKHDNV